MVCIDELADGLAKTIFSLRGSWSLAFCAWYTARLNCLAYAWAIAVSLVHLLRWANWRLVSGAPHVLDPQKDVVMVTGASGGLGLLVAAIFAERGFKVAAVDSRPARMNVASHHFTCDITEEKQVNELIPQIEKKMGSRPLVLVSCAGVAVGGSFLNLDSDEIRDCIDTNVLGTLWTVRSVLPHMISNGRGTLVGISSSTALASPAEAGVYAGSKAAILAFYESLRHELSRTGIKILCAVPGQLDTPMFASVNTPSRFLAPVCPALDMAERIVNSVLQGSQGMMLHPLYVRLLPVIHAVLPVAIVDFLRSLIGIDRAMRTWEKGIKDKKNK